MKENCFAVRMEGVREEGDPTAGGRLPQQPGAQGQEQPLQVGHPRRLSRAIPRILLFFSIYVPKGYSQRQGVLCVISDISSVKDLFFN